jgi:formate-dependent nitrite reductase membrane component NrfD
MSTPRPAERSLYAMAACVLIAIMSWVGVVVIGLYYFGANQAIPSVVDHIQVGMLVLAAVCGLTAVAMFVRFVVLVARRRRAEPSHV